jgi:hypothetical protein
MGFKAVQGQVLRSPLVMTDELLAILRKRIDTKYYDRPEVVDIVARAILTSRRIYSQ